VSRTSLYHHHFSVDSNAALVPFFNLIDETYGPRETSQGIAQKYLRISAGFNEPLVIISLMFLAIVELAQYA
jgi:hypothetical protein